MKVIKREYPERFYIGVEKEGGIKPNVNPRLGLLWQQFMDEDFKLLNPEDIVDDFIGLECYPPNFMDTREYDYFAMVQTKTLVKQDGFVSKKLPAGTYISVEIEFDQISDEIHKAYKFVKEEGYKVHYGFDYEDYILGQDYSKPGARLYLSLLLEED